MPRKIGSEDLRPRPSSQLLLLYEQPNLGRYPSWLVPRHRQSVEFQCLLASLLVLEMQWRKIAATLSHWANSLLCQTSESSAVSHHPRSPSADAVISRAAK